MDKLGPIIIIEDDADDQIILGEVFETLKIGNKLLFFSDGVLALNYLNESHEKPFLIISDINMPRLSGFQLREKIQNNEDLRLKCIPYLFFTTASSHQAVIDAYSRSIQGFFIKPHSIAGLERTIQRIVDYWRECASPNYLD